MKITKQRIKQIIKEELESASEINDNKGLGNMLLDMGKTIISNPQVSSESPMLAELIVLLVDKTSSGNVDTKVEEILNFAKSKLGEQQ